MFRSTVYLGGLTLACAVFYLGSASTSNAGQVEIDCINQVPAIPVNLSGPQGSANQKGSVVIFSKIEVRWNAAGDTLLQDTFIDLTNDYPADVYIQGWFINGDIEIEEERDAQGNITTQFEPGWNTADCRFQLTGNQPTWWSAARGGPRCQAFTVLDPQGPGRLDPETGNTERVLRGYALFYAVKFDRAVGPTGAWVQINWNHLKGDAVIAHYGTGSAWEYNAWAFQARVGALGQPIGIPGTLIFGGEYQPAYDELILDFYATGTGVHRSPGSCSNGDACRRDGDCFVGTCDLNAGLNITTQLDTDLTLHPLDLDLRQDGCGPLLTKAEIRVTNENESTQGVTRCICCWDSVRLSAINVLFTRTFLGTDKGKAVIDGVHTDVANCRYEEICGISPFLRKLGPNCKQPCAAIRCPGPGCGNFQFFGFAEPTPLLGVAAKRLTYTPTGDADMAGMNLQGTGAQAAVIMTDVEEGPGEARDGSMRRSTSISDVKSSSASGR